LKGRYINLWGAWWPIGRFDAFRPLRWDLWHSCLWHFDGKLRHSISMLCWERFWVY